MDLTLADRAPGRRRGRRRVLVALLLGATLASVGAGASSLAYFTDTASNSGSWTSGSIKLALSPATTVFTAPGILPGDSGRQTVNVANTGVSQMRYRISSTLGANDNNIASQISFQISSGACPAVGTPVSGDLYSGGISGAGYGDFTLSPKTGRTLNGGANENLCFSWAFANTATSTYASSSLGATFLFSAEQTANNS